MHRQGTTPKVRMDWTELNHENMDSTQSDFFDPENIDLVWRVY